MGVSPSASSALSAAVHAPGKLEDPPGAPARFSQGRGRRQAGACQRDAQCRAVFIPAKAACALVIESIKINNYRAATDRLSVTALFYEYAIGIGLFDRMFFTGRKIPGR